MKVQILEELKDVIPAFPRLLVRSAKNFNSHQGFIRACAVTYATIIALVPSVLVLAMVATMFGYWDYLLNSLPKLVGASNLELPLDTIIPFLKRTTNVDPGSTGLIGILALSISFIGAMSNLETNLNVVWRAPKNRNIFKRYAMYAPFLFLLVGAIFVLSLIMQKFREYLDIYLDSENTQALHDFLQVQSLSVSGLGFLWFFIFMLYWIVPNTTVRKTPAAFSATFTLGTLAIITALSVSIQEFLFARLSVIYGSLSILPFSMMILYGLWIAILFGGALNYEIQTWLEHWERKNK